MHVRFRRFAAGLSAGALLTGVFAMGTASATATPSAETANRFADVAAAPFAQRTAPPAPPEGKKTEKQQRTDRILQAAAGELGTTETGSNCQPYSSQCVSWCALFAMWTWEEGGVDVDNEAYAFTGNVYTEGQEKGTAYDSSALDQAEPGDVLMFGTGPESADSSTHIGVVEKVDGDTVTTIEGNSGSNADRVQRNEHPLSSEIFYGGVHPW